MERNSLVSERYLLRGAPNARDAAEARYGSMDAFLLQALGVGEAEREILRARWLTE